MTREQAKKLAPIIQAYGQGLPVQVSDGMHWEDYKGEQADFGNPNLKWRIKPEPRDFWIGIPLPAQDPDSERLDSQVDGARVWKEPVTSVRFEIVHVREVF